MTWEEKDFASMSVFLNKRIYVVRNTTICNSILRISMLKIEVKKPSVNKFASTVFYVNQCISRTGYQLCTNLTSMNNTSDTEKSDFKHSSNR